MPKGSTAGLRALFAVLVVLAAALADGGLAESGAAAQPAGARPARLAATRPTFLGAQEVNRGSLLVAFRAPVAAYGARVRVAPAAARSAGLPPATAARGADQVNHTLADARAAAVRRLFANIPQAELRAAEDRAQRATGRRLIDLSQVYQVVFDPRQDSRAVAGALAASPLVDAVTPDYRYARAAPEPASGARSAPAAVRAKPETRVRGDASELPDAASLPANYGFASDGQSYHDAAGNNVTGAVVEIARRFHQQPGQGETIVNLSLGTVDDSSTVVENGQRYLEQRGFPRIPAYLARQRCAAERDGAQSCSVDLAGNAVNTSAAEGDLGEVLLDFSVMAPPPRGDARTPNPQPPGQLGEILGAAYGASYRLVNPMTNSTADFFAGLLGAGFLQHPAPSVITASVGNGLHAAGFPDDFFEAQRMIHDIVTTLVNGRDIFVSISAGDGQSAEAAAGPPNGLSGPYALAPPGMVPPDLDGAVDNPDFTYLWTNETRYVADSGAVSAGGVTLNDIFNNAPANTAIPARLRHNPVTTETRWTGQQNFHSGNGPRVNLSAPADDVLFLAQVEDEHKKPVDPISVQPQLIGGTSAACPEIAAAAAAVRQVARLTGQKLTARQVRDLLVGTAHPAVKPTFDRARLNVGPTLDETAAVDELLARAGLRDKPRLVRMTVAERKAVPYDSGYGRGFYTDTPQDAFAGTAAIDLGQGLTADSSNTKEALTASGDNVNAPITFAVDVAALPRSARWSWRLALGDRVVEVPDQDFDSGRPFLRLLPSEIFGLLGEPVTASADRVVAVTAAVAGQSITERVTFAGQGDGGYSHARAAVFDPLFRPRAAGSPSRRDLAAGEPADGVVVHYDLRGLRGVDGGQLVVGDIDRAAPRAFPDTDVAAHGTVFPLSGLTGAVRVPVGALRGAGVYGIALRGTLRGLAQDGRGKTPNTTGPWLPLRVVAAVEATPSSPKVRAVSSGFGGAAPLWWDVVDTKPAGGSPDFAVNYDVRGVPGARGALVEFSAPAADFFRALFLGTAQVGNANNFANPLGDRLDSGNRLGQPGGVAHRALPATHGAASLSVVDLGLRGPDVGGCDRTYQVRVFATDASGRIIGTASYTSLLSVANTAAKECQPQSSR